MRRVYSCGVVACGVGGDAVFMAPFWRIGVCMPQMPVSIVVEGVAVGVVLCVVEVACTTCG